MKKCPFCAEEIQEEAIYCRYCHKDLVFLKPKKWRYFTNTYNFRNVNEAGMWLKVEGNPANQAKEYFWNELHSICSDIDEAFLCKIRQEGWEIAPPRDSSCVQIDLVRNSQGYNPRLAVLSAILTSGGSLIDLAIGFQKWWPSKITLSYRKETTERKDRKTFNLYFNHKDKEFEIYTQDPITYQWYILKPPEKTPEGFNGDFCDLEYERFEVK